MLDFDSIIDATTSYGGASVVNENNDASSINWAHGLADPGEMIGCGMYQQLRRQSGESDETYQVRLAREMALLPADHAARITEAMKAAAMERFGMETISGKIMLFTSGKLPWSDLGTNVETALDSATTIRLSGMDKYNVVKVPMSYPFNGLPVESPDTFAIIRGDTGQQFGITGSRYKVRQPLEAFSFLDGALSQFGAKYASAGIIRGGQKAFVVAELPQQAFALAGNDEIKAFATFAMSWDCVSADYVFPTNVRSECANTFRQAMGDADKGIRLTHVGDIRRKVQDAQRALGIAVQGFDRFRSNAETMVHKPMAFRPYLSSVLDETQPVSAVDAAKGADRLADEILAQADTSNVVDEIMRECKRKELQAQIQRRAEIQEEILGRYESSTNGVNGMRGTAWGAFNAVTEYADHNRTGRQRGSDTERAARRFESIMNGDRDEIKQVAYRLATR